MVALLVSHRCNVDHGADLSARATAEVLPRAQWLATACPLTPETRSLINARALARLPRGQRMSSTLRAGKSWASLRSSRRCKAAISPAPISTCSKKSRCPRLAAVGHAQRAGVPHNSAAAAGNDARVYAIFLDNLERWMRGAPLQNEVRRAN